MRPARALGPHEWEQAAHSVIALVAAGIASAALAAQSSGHPHVAPLAPNFSLLPPISPVSKVSPLMNQPDGVWNLGESTIGADQGGALGPDFVVPLPTHRVVVNWQALPQLTGADHYIGSLERPGGNLTGDDPWASFELVGPSLANYAGEDIVVAMFTPSTFGAPPAGRPYEPHDYPGDPNYHGLLVPNGLGFHVEMVKRNLQVGSPAYRVVGVQFTPRTSARPIVFTMQRLRQVRRAALALITTRYGVSESRVAFLVSGGSFGGLTAPLATIFYPQEFHSAAGLAYSGAHRSMPSDYSGFTMITSGLGLDVAGNGYLMRDTVEIPMWAFQELTDYTSMSFTNRLFHGHVQRPVYLAWADEDPVTHGTDWAMILLGTPTSQGQQPQHGRVPWTNVFSQSVNVRWSVVPKTCHEADPPDAFVLEKADGTTDTTNDPLRITEEMITVAHQELARNPNDIKPITDPALGRQMSPSLTFPSLDHNQPALSHSGNRTYNAGSQPNLLVENTTFKRYGQGTWLGANESLKVVRVGSDDRDSVFVGSADGYVTRHKMQPKGSNPTIEPLVEVARSNRNFGSGVQPYALGHGTWGLVVGNIDDNPDLEVVVASYDRIGVFRADTLAWVREVQLPSWEYTNPRKLAIADLDGGPTNEIVFRTLINHLVIMDGNLNILREHREGGVIDLVAGPSPTPRANNPLKRPVYLLSARGHVVRLEFDASLPPGNCGVLAGASPLQYGGLRDMDLVTWQGQERLAVLCVPQLGTDDAIRFYSVDECELVGSFGDIHTPNVPGDEPLSVAHVAASGDMEPSFTYVAGHGGDRYVISSGGDLSVWNGTQCLGHKRLRTFPPADNHGCLAAGDIDPNSNGHEVVIASTAGKLAWFKLDDLYSDLSFAGQTITLPRTFALDGGVLYEDRCNLSLGATWAMAAEPASGSTPGKLRVIDPVGTWWEVTPDGTPAIRRDIGVGAWGLVPAKASSLVYQTGGTDHLAWETSFDPILGARLWSRPYVPDYGFDFMQGDPPNSWWLPTGIARAHLQFEEGHWICPATGTLYDDGSGVIRCAWWHKYGGRYPNLIQQVKYTVTGGAATIQSIWGSTQQSLNGYPPPRWPNTANGWLKPLRTESGSFALPNTQSIRIGKVLLGVAEPQVIATCMGGRVMVLSGVDGKILAESEDYGMGGMALAVADLNGDGYDEVVFAPLYSPIAHTGGKVRSHVRVLSGNSTGGLTQISSVPVGDLNNDDFVGWGACGILVADLPASPAIAKAILVTTVNGELVVFQHTNGAIDPNPVYRKVVEGSIGGYNSIVVADLDPADSRPELYLGGSSGIRRFDFP